MDLTRLQERAQGGLPLQPNNGNPQGANNMAPLPNPNQQSNYYGQQVPNAGRYRPPTMSNASNQTWNDTGGYHYNLPNAFGSYQGYSQGGPNPNQGPGLGSMFAPMPQGGSSGDINAMIQQLQQYMQNQGGSIHAGRPPRQGPSPFAGGEPTGQGAPLPSQQFSGGKPSTQPGTLDPLDDFNPGSPQPARMAKPGEPLRVGPAPLPQDFQFQRRGPRRGRFGPGG